MTRLPPALRTLTVVDLHHDGSGDRPWQALAQAEDGTYLHLVCREPLAAAAGDDVHITHGRLGRLAHPIVPHRLEAEPPTDRRTLARSPGRGTVSEDDPVIAWTETLAREMRAAAPLTLVLPRAAFARTGLLSEATLEAVPRALQGVGRRVRQWEPVVGETGFGGTGTQGPRLALPYNPLTTSAAHLRTRTCTPYLHPLPLHTLDPDVHWRLTAGHELAHHLQEESGFVDPEARQQRECFADAFAILAVGRDLPDPAVLEPAVLAREATPLWGPWTYATGAACREALDLLIACRAEGRRLDGHALRDAAADIAARTGPAHALRPHFDALFERTDLETPREILEAAARAGEPALDALLRRSSDAADALAGRDVVADAGARERMALAHYTDDLRRTLDRLSPSRSEIEVFVTLEGRLLSGGHVGRENAGTFAAALGQLEKETRRVVPVEATRGPGTRLVPGHAGESPMAKALALTPERRISRHKEILGKEAAGWRAALAAPDRSPQQDMARAGAAVQRRMRLVLAGAILLDPQATEQLTARGGQSAVFALQDSLEPALPPTADRDWRRDARDALAVATAFGIADERAPEPRTPVRTAEAVR